MKWITLLFTALLFTGCSTQETKNAKKGMPVVYTVNYPLAYFAERMAGEAIEIVFPEMEGDPAFWEPTPDQVAAYQEADLILLNGAAYSKWVPKVSLPQSKLVNTTGLNQDMYIPLDGVMNHSHGPGAAHAHGDLAFTTWLDPKLAEEQIMAIDRALSERLDVKSSTQSLSDDLQKLDNNLREAFAGLNGQPLVGSHPVYQYLARAYGLNMKSVHWEPDAEPDNAMWRELEDILEAHDAKIMLWEDEPLASTKTKLAEKGIQSIVFNPCGNRPASGDYLTVMQQNIENLK